MSFEAAAMELALRKVAVIPLLCTHLRGNVGLESPESRIFKLT